MARRRPDERRVRAAGLAAAACLIGSTLARSAPTPTTADIADTKHNLSVSGRGTIRASTETRICVFCHTPHNATPLSPLWNKALEPRVYTMYTSPTLQAGPLPQPSGATKLCLSCHDGTIAMGAVVNPAGGIRMAGGDLLLPQSLANLGLDLSGHHPVSFPYHTALPNDELAPSPPSDLTYGGTDEVQCTTCHDPHDDLYGKFLVEDNRYSALCIECHQLPEWPASAHATSTESVVGILPRPPKTWPTYTQLGEWGCEACHTPHFAATPEQLLNFTAGPPAYSCTTAGCHGSDPTGPPHGAGGLRRAGRAVDVGRQARKVSAHREVPGRVAALPSGTGVPPGPGAAGVGCADCHNPHAGSGEQAEAPYASGLLRGVSGIDRNGAPLRVATYEYEICFKCHAESSPTLDYVPRVLGSTNARLEFAVENPSYHPVVSGGRNLDVPSIPSSFEPAMSPADMIYCTACHADDEGGSRGPHGSSFAPLLKERCETADHTPESFGAYALCYRCHERSSILRDDSFRKAARRGRPSGGGHSGHLSVGVPCSACHDPHGVYEGGAMGTGSHTHLINFDTRIVLPRAGAAYPVFTDAGGFSGSCDLVCHGVDHDGASYP